ncbi:hypothetical protein [Pontibacillus salipaludis]|uniref:Uncharacterized protein n=1 Tax=Pontibacillus salipaludis TaxID=1697394 RepID=A0ABQ1Q2V8_9BACI|nr:hypothetical protein [Pontibacillus salipaludis]GGD10464.1 hypothetical protein GCM10011389_17580 [Pontibacillus salipaludis]
MKRLNSEQLLEILEHLKNEADNLNFETAEDIMNYLSKQLTRLE